MKGSFHSSPFSFAAVRQLQGLAELIERSCLHSLKKGKGRGIAKNVQKTEERRLEPVSDSGSHFLSAQGGGRAGVCLGIDSDLCVAGVTAPRPLQWSQIISVRSLPSMPFSSPGRCRRGRERLAGGEIAEGAYNRGVADVLSKIDDYQLNENDGLAMTCRQR